MNRNVGAVDRLVRVVAGTYLLFLSFRGWTHWVGMVGMALVVSGVAGYCPLYRIVGVRTCRRAS